MPSLQSLVTKVVTLPSVTTWTRVEPLPREGSMQRSLQAQIRDGLWMIARQWQLGEFLGDDAGSPVNASLGVIVPRSEIVRPVRDNGKLVLFVMAVFVLIAVGVGIWLGNQVSRPIQDLTVLVDKASKGMLEVQQIPTGRQDEVGILAGAFNRMLANLATVLKELEQRGEKLP